MAREKMQVDELLEFTRALSIDHLGLALDLLYRSRDLSMRPERPWSWILAGRSALSSVLHSFAGLESAVNLIGHQLFFDTDSPRFIPHESRSIPLKRMLKAWRAALPLADKLNLVLSVSDCSLPPGLENELRELTTLRNWIAHGIPYKSVVLVQPQADGTLLEVDREDSVDWPTKFPNTKFHSPDMFDHNDAYTANRIVFEIIRFLATATDELFFVQTWEKGPNTITLGRDSDLEDLLRS